MQRNLKTRTIRALKVFGSILFDTSRIRESSAKLDQRMKRFITSGGCDKNSKDWSPWFATYCGFIVLIRVCIARSKSYLHE